MATFEKDSLGNRMKGYEGSTTSEVLMRGLPVIARMDGRAFHSFTRGLTRPYDERMSKLMVETTKYLVKETGALTGYVQSDEISLLFYAPNPESQIFFDGRLFKMVSTLASMTTLFFNKQLKNYLPEKADKDPMFDARVFTVPNEVEATNYFVWREKDATRNSVSMAAQSMFNFSELQNKSSSEMQEMMWQKGVNWNDYPAFFRRGTYVQKKVVERVFTDEELLNLPLNHAARNNPDLKISRSVVDVVNMPPITKLDNRVNVIFSREEVQR